MPRVGREQSGTGIYHVMLRGINRQDMWTIITTLLTLIALTSSAQEISMDKATADDYIKRLK